MAADPRGASCPSVTAFVRCRIVALTMRQRARRRRVLVFLCSVVAHFVKKESPDGSGKAARASQAGSAWGHSLASQGRDKLSIWAAPSAERATYRGSAAE